MMWWDRAIYDTCSLITLDKLLLDRPALEVHFREVLAIEASFSTDQLWETTATRMFPRVTYVDMPSASDLARILTAGNLSKALTQVDKLVFATAVHHGLPVVTGDKRLARAVAQEGLCAGNVAFILRTLVEDHVLSEATCDAILADLTKRGDFILPQNRPQTWATLRHYTFP
jgi:hypothetical protein